MSGQSSVEGGQFPAIIDLVEINRKMNNFVNL